MEKPTQTFILGHRGGNGCYSCKGVTDFAIAIALGTSLAGRDTLHLVVVLSHLSSWDLHLPHVQRRFKTEEMLQNFVLRPQGAQCT